MFMCYRGGGIGHMYMREIENRFEDMRLEQTGLGAGSQVAQPPWGADGDAGGPPVSLAKAATPIGNTPMADSDDDGHTDGEDSEGERMDINPGEGDYPCEEEDDASDDNVGDGIWQGTYGMAEY